MSFVPSKNRILVLPDPPPEKVGSLWMSEATKKRNYRPTTGTVVRCGDVDEHYTKYEHGTRVIFNPDWQGEQLGIDGHVCLLMHSENVFGHQLKEQEHED